MIRIVIADDNAIVRAGLTQLLTSSDEIDLVGVASNGAEAIELVGEHSPDVVLIDLVMPEVDGVEATRRLVAERAELPVVVLTSFSDRERILAALDAGAVGYRAVALRLPPPSWGSTPGGPRRAEPSPSRPLW